MKTGSSVSPGTPDTENPHVLIDEGKVASAKTMHGALLCKNSVFPLLHQDSFVQREKNGSVFINSDAWNFWLDPAMGTMSRDELMKAIERDVDFYAVKGVTAIFYNLNFQRCFFPTKVGTPYWKDISFAADGKMLLRGQPITYDDGERAKQDPDYDYRTMYYAVTNMIQRLPEYRTYRYNYCHSRGVEMWHSFRVNDVHFATQPLGNRPQHSDFWLDNKDCLRAWYRHEWRSAWQDNSLDYGNGRVYDYQLGIVREYLMGSPSDGLEFDWLRALPIFKPGFDDVHRDRLTQFLRDTRRIADEAGRKWGHRIRLAHRVPARVHDAWSAGLDVAAWAREGLVDVLMPGGCPATETEQDCEIGLYRALAPKPVVLAAEIDCIVFSRYGWYESIDKQVYSNGFDAGFASSFYQQGADGIYFYNHFPRHAHNHAWIHEFFGLAANRETVAKMVRRHPATYHIGCDENRRGESPFPYEIPPKDSGGGVNICCGEGNAGRKAKVIVGATVPLDVEILVNTVPCGRANALDDASGYVVGPEKTAYYEVEIPIGVLHDGINSVELFNHGEQTITRDNLVWMEVQVLAG